VSSVAEATPGGFFTDGVIYHRSTMFSSTYRPEFWCQGTAIHPDLGLPVAFGFYRGHPGEPWMAMTFQYDEWTSGYWAPPGHTPPVDAAPHGTIAALAALSITA
jgi:hypothetical protein